MRESSYCLSASLQWWTGVTYLDPDPTLPTSVRPVTRPTRQNCLQSDRDPTLPDFMQMQCVTLQTTFLQ